MNTQNTLYNGTNDLVRTTHTHWHTACMAIFIGSRCISQCLEQYKHLKGTSNCIQSDFSATNETSHG